MPTEIDDTTRNHATSAGVYVQDEWKIARNVTINYGGRFDVFEANFDNESQFSPRVNLVWKVDDKTTAHIGYARYFVPPPVQYVPPSTIAKFANTTNAPSNFIDDPPKVERSNYYDLGFSRQMSKQWLVNVDGFYKQADQLVDLGQFGQALILSPFNYEKGFDYGPEVSTTYKLDNFSTFGNFAWVQTGGRNIDSQQFLIDSDELAYIQDHYIKLDHESAYTMSAGVSYNVSNYDLVYIDALYGSGLRSGFANLDHTEPYYPVNLGYQHVFRISGSANQSVTARIDIVNVFDQVYQLRNGSGVGVGRPSIRAAARSLRGLGLRVLIFTRQDVAGDEDETPDDEEIGLVPIFTMVLWLTCVAVFLVGVMFDEPPPAPATRPTTTTPVELLSVDLSNEPEPSRDFRALVASLPRHRKHR